MSKFPSKGLSNFARPEPAGWLASIEQEIHRHLHFTLGHHDQHVDPHYLYRALAIAVRVNWSHTGENARHDYP